MRLRVLISVMVAGLALLLPGTARADAVLDGRTLRVQDDAGQVVSTRTFPAQLGAVSGPVTQDALTWVAVGPALFAYTASGEERARLDLPAEVTSLDAGGGLLQVSTMSSGVRQGFTVSGRAVQGRVVLPPDVAVTGWLARAADLVPQAGLDAASRQDPANPFLWLRLARLSGLRGDRFTAEQSVRRALAARVPFASSVALAAGLDTAGYPQAADAALAQAARDYAARGYDPSLSVSQAALRAYGNPLGELNVLLSQNKLRRADAWLRYLRLTSPRFEGYPETYARYARVLDAQDRGGEADEWRQFARELSSGTLYNLGPGALQIVGAAARLLALALLLAAAAALTGFTAHYWAVQGREVSPLGGRYRSWLRHPLSRARRVTVAYAGFGEKLVLVSLLISLLLSLSAWAWAGRVQARLLSPPLTLGTFGGAQFYDGLDQLAPGGAAADLALIRGLAAQLDGDTALARQTYAAAGPLPGACVLNNLGVLSALGGDAAQAQGSFRQALAQDPGQVAAAYNLGLHPQSPETGFQAAFRPGQPRLCYPDQQTLIQALDPSPLASGAALLRGTLDSLGSPGALLSGPLLSGPQRLQGALTGLLLLLTAVSVLWLLVPRLPASRQAGRPWLFRVAALLLPGSSLLDGAWGSVLLLGWAMTLSVLAGRFRLLPAQALLGAAGQGFGTALIIVLAGIYALNVLVFVVDELRFARGQRRVTVTGP